MRSIVILVLAGVCVFGYTKTQPASATNIKTLREQLFHRFLRKMYNIELMENSGVVEKREPDYTNMMRTLFEPYIVDPTLGLEWDEVPAPSLTNAAAMDPILNFIKTNGWNMASGDIFGEMTRTNPMKSIRGLPWAAIKEREFPGVTSAGILYVLFTGWHHNLRGVAYNPETNTFTGRLAGFVPIGQHWYAWVTSDDPETTVQQYEGRNPSVHPWSEFSSSMLTNASAMKNVLNFIESNGWNMATNDIFEDSTGANAMKPIQGLPWPDFKYGEFDAVTSNGILYVFLTGWNHNFKGIAYNPRTNPFISGMCFKPIGMHWYIWASGEKVLPFIRQCEGQSPGIQSHSAP